jgi:hypothetical protein
LLPLVGDFLFCSYPAGPSPQITDILWPAPNISATEAMNGILRFSEKVPKDFNLFARKYSNSSYSSLHIYQEWWIKNGQFIPDRLDRISLPDDSIRK